MTDISFFESLQQHQGNSVIFNGGVGFNADEVVLFNVLSKAPHKVKMGRGGLKSVKNSKSKREKIMPLVYALLTAAGLSALIPTVMQFKDYQDTVDTTIADTREAVDDNKALADKWNQTMGGHKQFRAGNPIPNVRSKPQSVGDYYREKGEKGVAAAREAGEKAVEAVTEFGEKAVDKSRELGNKAQDTVSGLYHRLRD